MPATPVRKGNLRRIDLPQPAPLKCVFAQSQHPMPCTPARKGNLHPIASISPFEVYPETAAHDKPYNFVTCIPNFAAYIIDGGQGWTAAVVLLDM